MYLHKAKPFMSIDEQIDILRTRGLVIKNIDYAHKVLGTVNYYRLSAYTLSYKTGDSYYDDVTIENIYSLYSFDRRLRLLLLEVLEPIEIAFRQHIAYYHTLKYGPMGYTIAKNFNNLNYHKDFMDALHREINRSKEIFISDHKAKGKEMPFWVAIEILPFGVLSKLYKNLKLPEQKKIASEYGVPFDYISSWLYSLSTIRNICAHYGRLYNRKLSACPKLIKQSTYKIKKDYLFARFKPINILSQRDNWEGFSFKLKELIKEYQEEIKLDLLGFPNDWENILDKW